MKRWGAAIVFVLLFCTAAAAKGPEINLIDSKLSVNAEAISLGRLLQLVDQATGMKSKVPPELANRNISVKFSSLNVDDAVRKIFQGLPLDYVVITGKSIIVTAASQTASSAGEAQPAYPPPPSAQQIEQPFVQDFPPPQQMPFQQQQQQGQPPMVQTPFGPIPNPRAQQAPVATPGQQNPLFTQPGQSLGQPIIQPQQGVGVPGAQIGSPSPFGAVSPFGTQNPPANSNNGLFAPPSVIGPAGIQQR